MERFGVSGKGQTEKEKSETDFLAAF